MTYALAAAGTGGHVYPAIAVADQLVERGVSADSIVFFGGSRMEMRAVPAAGYDFVEVEIRGLRRSLSPQNLTLPWVVRRASKAIGAEMRRRRVRALAVFGGYISVPAAMAARRARVPIVVHEQNARPGLANRLIAPRAEATLVAFEAATRRLEGAVVVGNPLRRELAEFDRAELRDKARDEYGLSGAQPVLGVLGGSLGAHVLNETTKRIAAESGPDELSIVHLTGPSHIEALAPLAAHSGITWVTRAFESAMEMFYAAADVVIARAGAMTVSELMATATPSILVPLEATNQEVNARQLAAGVGTVIVAQDDIARVPSEARRLLGDGSRRRDMAAAAAALARPGAADAVARRLMEAAGG